MGEPIPPAGGSGERTSAGGASHQNASMPKPSPHLVHVGDHPVHCGFCSFDRFYDREIKLNTTGMTFMGLDFMNASSVGLICGRCGYVMEFVNDGLRFLDPAPG
jgi:hypothetical protein